MYPCQDRIQMLHYFLGGSVTRGLYKDLIWLLNTDTLIDYEVTFINIIPLTSIV